MQVACCTRSPAAAEPREQIVIDHGAEVVVERQVPEPGKLPRHLAIGRGQRFFIHPMPGTRAETPVRIAKAPLEALRIPAQGEKTPERSGTGTHTIDPPQSSLRKGHPAPDTYHLIPGLLVPAEPGQV